MHGMNAKTGKPLAGEDHLWQSVSNIILTPVGTLPMFRDYGSKILSMTDTPISSSTLVDFYAATAEALEQWEDRIDVRRVTMEVEEVGRIDITIQGIYLPTGESVTLNGVKVR
ncbi:hypothetical protein EDC56_1259 [Sinobacterium caligoides]|uniref:IraD/Gp25-like domain-containing protein n=1 Tax=Sinobacterium caligoides TaxID=933926 RepID=A0A3N2E0S6_9GAMM|nr:GPW/gp25 family protein [Sinobacterium caligoides]ROS05710.1 hypothetical protein EDC56_1259 [Sinobacterium caligoides]